MPAAGRGRSARLLAPVARRPQSGLVPIDDPASFAWPGYWIAAVADPDGHRDAVLMFGVPSGPLLDPGGLLTRGGTLVEGVVIAPFQLGLEWRRRMGSPRSRAESLPGCWWPSRPGSAGTGALRRGAAGRGLEGDRNSAVRGTFSGSGRGYEVTLIEAEALDSLATRGSRSPGSKRVATSSPAASG